MDRRLIKHLVIPTLKKLVEEYKDNKWVVCGIILVNGLILFGLLNKTNMPWIKDFLFVFWDVGSTTVAFLLGSFIKSKM